MRKDKLLINDMKPCDTNIYDETIITIADAKAKGVNPCPYKSKCDEREALGGSYAVACTMRLGIDVAKYIAGGSTLDAELDELKHSGLLDNRSFVNSADRQNFEEIKGCENILQEIKRVAEYLLT